MSRTRLALMAVILAILAGLGFWQYRRVGEVRACLDAGMIWDGSRCLKGPGAPILQRELQRS